MVEVLMRRTIGGLSPEGESEAPGVLKHYPIGSLVTVEIKDIRRRSVQRHRWLFALLNKVWANQSYFPTVDALRFALLTKLGFVDHYRLKGGEAVIVPRSMAFASMDETEFEQLSDKIVAFVCDEVIPGMEPGGLRNEIAEMVGALELRE